MKMSFKTVGICGTLKPADTRLVCAPRQFALPRRFLGVDAQPLLQPFQITTAEATRDSFWRSILIGGVASAAATARVAATRKAVDCGSGGRRRTRAISDNIGSYCRVAQVPIAGGETPAIEPSWFPYS
jgi:hypothetical protein